MRPPPFTYRAATGSGDALSALAAHGGDAKVLAGGQGLVPMLNFRLLSPAVLVDINRVPGLELLQDDGAGGLLVGDAAQGADPGDRAIATSSNETLCFFVELPLGSTGPQGASTTATFTFVAEQTVNNP